MHSHTSVGGKSLEQCVGLELASDTRANIALESITDTFPPVLVTSRRRESRELPHPTSSSLLQIYISVQKGSKGLVRSRNTLYWSIDKCLRAQYRCLWKCTRDSVAQ